VQFSPSTSQKGIPLWTQEALRTDRIRQASDSQQDEAAWSHLAGQAQDARPLEESRMERENCWESKNCGRQPEGEQVEDLGVCPAARPSEYDGLHGGTYAGRFCWAVAGTFCGGEVQATFAKKLLSCLDCEFLKEVNKDEGGIFLLTPKRAKD
jgi:hypothetical protein